MKSYSFLHWHKHLDPIAMDNIRSRGLPVRHLWILLFDFCWCYFNILLLVALHLFCFFLNPICFFIVFYIFPLYYTPEFSSFFLIRYYILFVWFSIQFLIELWLVRLKQYVLPILPMLLFFHRFRVAAFALIRCIPFPLDSIQMVQPCLLTFLSETIPLLYLSMRLTSSRSAFNLVYNSIHKFGLLFKSHSVNSS